MKLSEISTDRAIDVLCEITPYVNNIIIDEKLLSEIKAKVKATGKESKAEIFALGAEKVNRIAPVVLKEHKADIFGILASLNGADIDAIGKQNIIKTMSQIRDLIKDKEFLDFFKSCEGTETKE